MNWCCFTLPVMFDFKPNLKKGPCFSSPHSLIYEPGAVVPPQTNVKVKDSRANDNICRSSIQVVDKGKDKKSSKSPGPPRKIITVCLLTADKDRNVNIPYTFPRQPSDSLMVGPITGIKHFASLSNLFNVSFPSSAFVMLKDVAMS